MAVVLMLIRRSPFATRLRTNRHLLSLGLLAVLALYAAPARAQAVGNCTTNNQAGHDVRCFGARANDSTYNSLPGIQRAIDAACHESVLARRIVHLPEGRWRAWPQAGEEGLHVDSNCSGLHILGDGWQKTILEVRGANNTPPTDPRTGRPICQDVHTLRNPDFTSGGHGQKYVYWWRGNGIKFHGGIGSARSCSQTNLIDCTQKNTQAVSLKDVELADFTLNMSDAVMNEQFPVPDPVTTGQDSEMMWDQNFSDNPRAQCLNSWDTSHQGFSLQPDYYYDGFSIHGVKITGSYGEAFVGAGDHVGSTKPFLFYDNWFENSLADGISTSGALTSKNDHFRNIQHCAYENNPTARQVLLSPVITNDMYLPRVPTLGPTYRGICLPSYEDSDAGLDAYPVSVQVTNPQISNTRSAGISIEHQHNITIQGGSIRDAGLEDRIPIVRTTRRNNLVTVQLLKNPHWLSTTSVGFNGQSDSRLDGHYSITVLGPTTLRYTLQGPDSTSSGGTASAGGDAMVNIQAGSTGPTASDIHIDNLQLIADQYQHIGACINLFDYQGTPRAGDIRLKNISLTNIHCVLSPAARSAYQATGAMPIGFGLGNQIPANIRNLVLKNNVWMTESFSNPTEDAHDFVAPDTRRYNAAYLQPPASGRYRVTASFCTLDQAAHVSTQLTWRNEQGKHIVLMSDSVFAPKTCKKLPEQEIQACGNAPQCNTSAGNDPFWTSIRLTVQSSVPSGVRWNVSIRAAESESH